MPHDLLPGDRVKGAAAPLRGLTPLDPPTHSQTIGRYPEQEAPLRTGACAAEAMQVSGPASTGHATAAMTMDLYRHMIDRNLWDAARRLGGTGARPDEGRDDEGGGLGEK